MLVITTERATSARAIKATTLLAVPPGQHPTRIRPTARGEGKRSTAAINAASVGITRNWARTPMITGLGWRLTRRKSRGASPSPMPSMISPRPTVIKGPLNQLNSGG